MLVGLSAGGLTILEYLQNQNGWKNTHLFIAVGVPLHGSPLAPFFPVNTSLKEMKPGSMFLENIYKKDILHLNKIYTITAHSDNLVPENTDSLQAHTTSIWTWLDIIYFIRFGFLLIERLFQSSKIQTNPACLLGLFIVIFFLWRIMMTWM